MSITVGETPHYNFGEIEVLEVIEDWRLGFKLGNVLKYVARAPFKGDAVGDLKKAKEYLVRSINRSEEFETYLQLRQRHCWDKYPLEAVVISWSPNQEFHDILSELYRPDKASLALMLHAVEKLIDTLV